MIDLFIDDSFDTFWSVYPLKRSKATARKAFAKLTHSDKIKAINAVQEEATWRERMAAANEWAPPWKHASTWLNGECWEDEFDAVPEAKQKGSGAWEILIAQRGVVPIDEYPKFDDQKIFDALFKCGSWMELCRLTEKQAQFQFKPKFEEAYQSLGGTG